MSKKFSVADMELRDYFAAMAMQGTLSNFEWMQRLAVEHPDMPGTVTIAMSAYDVAEAMLWAREVTRAKEE